MNEGEKMLLGKVKPRIIKVSAQNHYYSIGGYTDKYNTLKQARKKAETLGKCVEIIKIKRINPLVEIEEKICIVNPPKTVKKSTAVHH